MKARIIIQPTGEVAVFVEQGEFEEGRDAILALFEALRAEGVAFVEVGAVERHRHTAEEVAQHLQQALDEGAQHG